MKKIKETAKAIGDDPINFGTHSLRSGGATALFLAGTDSTAIKLFGRWRSNFYEIYTRIAGNYYNNMSDVQW